MQDRTFVNAFCAGFPGAEVSQPFGPDHDCWKVGGKMFAIIGQRGDGVSVKTDHVETARLLIETGRAIRAPYLHASWARIPFGQVADAELRERIATSYALIRVGLPKKVQAALDQGAVSSPDG
ncbi:MmcQ/YjbR family DNA-binding protein [Tabrizicola thermarum]|uniref:MmcQ/YjbR family DNA-binding protein n=1 Tax=Tabrizicola thermarum TaxID=2670345 RepID=UPI000FFB65E5|nr:MmcQ/YjbR family DNA-binding protein [Tabrizicola thermarum]